MKCNGSLDAVKMKTEPIKDDDGNVIAHESFWMVMLKIPAKRIDANDLRDMVDELLDIDVAPFQQSMKLTGITVTESENGETVSLAV